MSGFILFKNDIYIFGLKILNGLKWLYLALILQKNVKQALLACFLVHLL